MNAITNEVWFAPTIIIAWVLIMIALWQHKRIKKLFKPMWCMHRDYAIIEPYTHSVIDVDGKFEGEVDLGYYECKQCGWQHIISKNRVHFNPRKTKAEYRQYCVERLKQQTT